jgi:hypothetical protein
LLLFIAHVFQRIEGCNAKAARWSISSGVIGSTRPLASNEQGSNVNMDAAGMAKTPLAVPPCFDGATT